MLSLTVLSLAACGEPADRTPGVGGAYGGAIGGTAIIAHFADIAALNILHTFDSMALQVQRDMLFMPLIRLGKDGQLEPWLAASWDTVRFAPDSVALTFRLRSDVHWHDGVPTTAEDVRFTWVRLMDPRTAAVASRVFSWYNPHAEVLDSHTIRFRLRAHGGFLAAWQNLPPLPVHRLADVPPAELSTHPFGREPLGNGPFMFEGRRMGRDWVFAANAGFALALGGRPRLDRVILRTVPDETARLVELQTGRVHFTTVSSSHAARLRKAAGIRLMSFESTRWTALFWNTGRPPFSDVRVRQALTLAIDRDALTRAVLDGSGTAGRSLVTPFHAYFDSRTAGTSLSHDPDSARALLAAAGFRVGHDGRVRDTEGTPLAFTISVMSSSAEHAAAAEIIQSDLSRIGVEAAVRRTEFSALIQQAMLGNDVAPPDAMVMSVLGTLRQDDSFLFHSRHLADASRLSTYSNPRLDSLLDVLALSHHDQSLNVTWVEYQELLAQEAPVSVLYYPRTLVAIDRRLNAVDVRAGSVLSGIVQWHFRYGERVQ